MLHTALEAVTLLNIDAGVRDLFIARGVNDRRPLHQWLIIYEYLKLMGAK